VINRPRGPQTPSYATDGRKHYTVSRATVPVAVTAVCNASKFSTLIDICGSQNSVVSEVIRL